MSSNDHLFMEASGTSAIGNDEINSNGNTSSPLAVGLRRNGHHSEEFMDEGSDRFPKMSNNSEENGGNDILVSAMSNFSTVDCCSYNNHQLLALSNSKFLDDGKSLKMLSLSKKHSSQYVKLNVGGTLYFTTIGTLCKQKNTMLSAMFSGRMEVPTDPEGWILIDRCGRHFGTILNYLRDGQVSLPDNSTEIAELLAEAKYYCIHHLELLCEEALIAHNACKPICSIPLITSQKEQYILIKASLKPVVVFTIQRDNNKYSYTNSSDDNLLKNIDLFDKLSLRYNGRIYFIKKIIGSDKICCWSFYGHDTKIAEICCTSIVYATDRKQTKVEFPEARIYEETLQTLLYENGNVPDQDLLKATSSTRNLSKPTLINNF